MEEIKTKPVVKIDFDTPEAAKEFLIWLCEQGEQDYWQWMDHSEDPENHAVVFDYWNGGTEFCTDLTIRTSLKKKRK